MERTPAGAGEEQEEEGASETMHGELTANPLHCPLHSLGRRGREIRSETEPRKKEGGEKMFLDLFLFLIIVLWF